MRMRTSSGHRMDASYARDLAQSIADRLSGVDGVVAVALGGSAARGEAGERSDLDIGIYYRADQPPSRPQLDAAGQELDDGHRSGLATELGEWGPWINGGAWLTVGGRRVDWLYRDIERVGAVIDDCSAGIVTCDYQPGHPHGFHNHIYAGEVHHAVALHDPAGVLSRLRARTEPYPRALQRAVIERYLWEAGFSLAVASGGIGRGDTFHAVGCHFRSVACVVQVLFALNERYFVNEKGSVATADALAIRPAHFGERVTRALATAGGTSADLARTSQSLDELVAEVRELVPSAWLS